MTLDTNTIGYIAAVLTSSAPVFQVGKTYLAQSAQGLSPSMWSIQLIGCLVWLHYGLTTNGPPIILGNTIVAISAVALLCAIGSEWWKNSRKGERT